MPVRYTKMLATSLSRRRKMLTGEDRLEVSHAHIMPSSQQV